MMAERDPAVISEFQARRKRQLSVMPAGVLVLVIGLWLGSSPGTMGMPKELWLAVIVLLSAAMLGLALFGFRNWRCPACNQYLYEPHKFNIDPASCGKCGAALR